MSIQLACNVTIPTIFNGSDGDSVYIDTEGSFIPERAYDIAQELSNHLKKLARSSGSRGRSQEAAAQSQGIHIFRSDGS